MKRIALALLATLVVAGAQEVDPPTAPPDAEETDPNLLLSMALRGPQTATNLVMTATVKHAPPKDGGMFGAAGGMVVINRSGGGSPKPFEGMVEACRMPDGSWILVSRTQLPGFELYLSEGRTIERTIFADERFSLAQLRAELGPLLDTGALARRILDAKPAGRRDGTKWIYEADVSKDIVRPTLSGSPMSPRVLKVRATLTVTGKGRLEQAAVTVTRNDPVREMMRGKMKGMRIQFGGAGAPPPPPPAEDDEKKHDIEGGSTTYTLTFESKQPSERIRVFEREIARLTDAR
ncbi:MAG: hypothetical protein ACYTF8_04105 [Planctomycetota bacterium]|jgi:hypothetical protein